MKVELLRKKINGLPEGRIFSLSDLKEPLNRNNYRVISILIEKKEIQRVRGLKGRFYVPREGILGLIRPTEGEIIQVLLTENKGYISGMSLFNEWSLTSQLSRVITVRSNASLRRASVEQTEIQFKKTRTPVTQKNIPSLQFMDVLEFWNEVPDLNPSLGIEILKEKMKGMDLNLTMRVSKFYPPRSQAFLGALIENTNPSMSLKSLKERLNPSSTYKLFLNEKDLPNKRQWNIH